MVENFSKSPSAVWISSCFSCTGAAIAAGAISSRLHHPISLLSRNNLSNRQKRRHKIIAIIYVRLTCFWYFGYRYKYVLENFSLR